MNHFAEEFFGGLAVLLIGGGLALAGVLMTCMHKEKYHKRDDEDKE